jgi:hypothetical protein
VAGWVAMSAPCALRFIIVIDGTLGAGSGYVPHDQPCMSLDCIRRWLFRSSVNCRQLWMQAEYGLRTSSSNSGGSDDAATPQQSELPNAEPAMAHGNRVGNCPAIKLSRHLSSARRAVFPPLPMLPIEQQRVLLEALDAQQRSDADSRCSGLEQDCAPASLRPGTSTTTLNTFITVEAFMR